MNPDSAPPPLPPAGAPPIAPPPLNDAAAVPRGPWPFWPSVGLMCALTAGIIAAQAMAVVVVVLIRIGEGRRLNAEAFMTDGLLLSLGMIACTPVGLGLSWWFIRLRKGPSVKEYLALRPFGWKDGTLGILGLGLLWVFSSWINPEPSQWMVKTLEHSGPILLFYLAIVILAPLIEG